MDSKINDDRRLGLLLAFIVVCSFIYFLFNSPEENPTLLAIVRFLAAIVAGLSGYLIAGTLELQGKLPFNKIQIQAGGAFAAFIMVFLLFFVGVPNIPEPEIFRNSIIEPKIDPIVSAPGGNGAILEVDLKNIPFKSQKTNNYRVAAFAKPEDNPDWYFQGINSVEDKLSFPLKLWDKGDKKHYSAVVIISSSNSENLSRIKTTSELINAAIKKSKEVRFYRNDYPT
jgi:hypothetical protein